MREALVNLGYLEEAVATRAWKAHETTGTAFHVVLTELGILPQEQLLSFWSEWLDLEAVADDAEIAGDLAEVLTLPFLTGSKVVPIEAERGELRIATANPLDQETLSTISFMLDRAVVPLCATSRQISALLDQLSVKADPPDSDSSVLISGGAHLPSDVEHLKALANEGPVVQQVNALLTEAYERGASDVHLEPKSGGLLVRYRVDGQLIEARHFEPTLQTAVISRLKIIGMMDITESRLPQDGRSSVVTGGKKIDLRISSLPTVDGESIVIRLLVQDASKLTWDKLGFSQELQEKLDSIIRRPSGLFLVTGPTGSGKTTTLYTALGQIDRRQTKVISVEDPVEYRLEGVVQVQIHQELGLDFASVLRTILRQNPNTVMVGEIRDVETAQIALRASMTGHQVFSTLHTDGAVSSINRLADMGVPRYLLGAHINGILSQRLVRKLCPVCSIWSEELFQPMSEGRECDAYAPVRQKMAVGCSKCNQSGYSGRTIVSELMIPSPTIKRLVSQGDSWQDIQTCAREEGFLTQFGHGMKLIAAGTTSAEELLANVEPS